MKRVVVAGGIGAGKSAVCERLLALGWPVIDADVIARRVVEKGQPAWTALRDAFGATAFVEDGNLDREFIADVVFHDASALKRLNHVTHGHIGAEIARELDAANGPAVFAAIPLFRPEHRANLSIEEVWSIQVDPETAVQRLCTLRGYSEEDARARIAAQMSNDERAKIVDRVIWNEGSLDDLYAQLDVALKGLGLSDD
ncbi:MAG TPA: dephospho-CoA kinase [Acidimicrobiales bacterium]